MCIYVRLSVGVASELLLANRQFLEFAIILLWTLVTFYRTVSCICVPGARQRRTGKLVKHRMCVALANCCLECRLPALNSLAFLWAWRRAGDRSDEHTTELKAPQPACQH